MKRKTSVIVLIVFAIVLLIAAALLVARYRPKTATTYEDASGIVYECSKPIRVKDQGVKYMTGAPSPTPVNQSDVINYCHGTGVE